MAGLGESCSHISAVLFYISYAVQLRDSKTVTEKKLIVESLAPVKKWSIAELKI